MSKPVTTHLPGRTIAALRAKSAPAVPLRAQWRIHPSFYLKTTDDEIVLRCWPHGRFEAGWSLRAVMRSHEHGVLLEGRIRCRSEVVFISLFSALALAQAVIAVVGLFGDQSRVGFPLGGAVLFLALTALLIHKRHTAMDERDALLYGYLASLQPSDRRGLRHSQVGESAARHCLATPCTRSRSVWGPTTPATSEENYGYRGCQQPTTETCAGENCSRCHWLPPPDARPSA